MLALVLSGCAKTEEPVPVLPSEDTVSAVAKTLVTALETGDLSGVTWTGDLTAIQHEYEIVTKGLEGLLPSVQPGKASSNAGNADAYLALKQTYSMGGQDWQFDSKAKLVPVGEAASDWAVEWAPSIVHPRLDGYSRLSAIYSNADRGRIMDSAGEALVWNRPVFNVGIDKTKADQSQWDSSARSLAAALGIDADSYAAKVANGGPQQFVVAMTVREGQVPPAIDSIPGGFAQAGQRSLGPSATFAVGLLGTATEATAEDIEKSDGVIKQGMVVGRSGLQSRYDEQLRGTRGAAISLAPRSTEDYTEPAEGVRVTATPIEQRVSLFNFEPVTGVDIKTTLNSGLQEKAESVLSDQGGVAALVALDVRTGAVLAAADSAAANGYSYATLGQYPPGSTFKLSTALALLRSGLTMDSIVSCPQYVRVGNTDFGNVPGYTHTGDIPLREAVAYSCNTAMAGSSQSLAADALPNAAASLGLGVKWDRGFDAFYGSVPASENVTTRAADAFGQGEVLASPMAMAGEIASVANGKTTVPYLLSQPVEGAPAQTPDPSTTALTESETAALQDAAQAVVKVGTGRVLQGLVTGAKSGSAEFVRDGQTLVHAWMIAYTGDYAIAAFVDVGESGSGTAAPLIKAFLS
jgi:cell division protein FtsI/penicillin-binding protein 2